MQMALYIIVWGPISSEEKFKTTGHFDPDLIVAQQRPGVHVLSQPEVAEEQASLRGYSSTCCLDVTNYHAGKGFNFKDKVMLIPCEQIY